VSIISGSFAAIVVSVCRPGSCAVQQLFFDELTNKLEWAAMYNLPVYVIGDNNVLLDL
jgi:hypothetical protein